MQAIHTEDAPEAIGPYSQAIKIGDTAYLSGQIALNPKTGILIKGDIKAQTIQVLQNIQAVVSACGGDFSQIVKLNIYMINLDEFNLVNETMQEFFKVPYPARATIGVSALPRAALIEIDAVLQLG